MNGPTPEQLDDAVLSITGRPEWAVIVKGLQNDIYHSQASALDAPNWDTVCELRGFAKGLAFVINLRDTVEGMAEVKKSNDAAL